MNAACSGCSCSPRARPSMVVISRPSTRAASERHDFTRLPSIRTVQAPHWPRPQPFFEPVRCKCSRNASRSVVRGSSVSRCSVPLTRSTTLRGAGAALVPCAAASGAARGTNGPAAKAPPVAAVSFSRSRRVGLKLVIFRPPEFAELSKRHACAIWDVSRRRPLRPVAPRRRWANRHRTRGA